ncbi:MAG: MFS transporter [Marinovum sp.]|nr:MFS transporter [Marinovum sp.]
MNPILLLTLAIAAVGANSLALSPLAQEVGTSFDLAAEDVLIATAVYGAGTAVAVLTLAPRADGLGLRRALVFALVAISIGLVMSVVSPNITVLAAGQGLAGLGAGVALPVTYALAAEIAPAGRESETLGKVLTGWTLSLVAGVSLAAVVADYFHWRGVFAVLAVLTLGLAALVWPTAKGTPRHGEKSSPWSALRVEGVPTALFTAAAYMAAFYGLYAYLGAHMTGALATSTTLAGVAALLYGVGFGLVAPLDRLIDRVGINRAAPLVFALLTAVYCALAMTAGQVWALLATCLLWGALNHLGLNLIVGRLTALDRTQRAAILGLYSATTYVSMFVGITAMRPVFTAYGFATTALIAACSILPALGLALRSRTRRVETPN